MAAGCPVVAALRPDNFPGIELRNREQLYLTEVGDDKALAEAIIEVLADPAAARATIGAAGQKLVQERFALSAVLDQHLAALDKLTKSRQG
jgi:glycosyltransferase involved in cell wall biosynthesis